MSLNVNQTGASFESISAHVQVWWDINMSLKRRRTSCGKEQCSATEQKDIMFQMSIFSPFFSLFVLPAHCGHTISFVKIFEVSQAGMASLSDFTGNFSRIKASMCVLPTPTPAVKILLHIPFAFFLFCFICVTKRTQWNSWKWDNK